MAGFIIALFLGVFYLTVLAILIGIFICMVLTYVFDSLAFFGMAKKQGLSQTFTAWIPFYHKVLFGRVTGKNTLGILSAIYNFTAFISLFCRFENPYLTDLASCFLWQALSPALCSTFSWRRSFTKTLRRNTAMFLPLQAP